MTETATDTLGFVTIGPDEMTPAKFPRLKALPSDLVAPVEALTERSPSGDEMKEIVELLQGFAERQESLQKALLDEGGQLDRMGKNWEQKLALLSSHVSSEIGRVIDMITTDRLTSGRASDPAIKLDLPVSVLVVDDDKTVCGAICSVLSDAGVTTHASHDSDDALSILSGELPIDICLVDLRMPRNGKGLAATILAEHPRVNVILMSGNEGRAASAALELGAHGTLGKPFAGVDALVLAVKICADHRRMRVHGSRPTP